MPVSATKENLNREQLAVFERLTNGENIFITGNAGTGKSFLVKAFDDWCEDNGITLVKTAPTGVAAMEISGATLHSQFKLKIGLDFDKPTKYPAWLDSADAILIDEVSMLRIDIFDKIMAVLLLANESRRLKKKKKPIQIIFCGDFYQLAPVINKDERPFLTDHYRKDVGGGYPFQSKFWRLFDVKMCNLTTIIRQQDGAFCNALDKCKTGDPSFIRWMQQVSAPREISGAIWVCGKNATAKQKNDENLARLSGRAYRSAVEYKGSASKKDKLCDEIFEYKIGARVVMLKNDSEGMYQNGSMGTITDKVGDVIRVKIDNNGETVDVERAEFPKYEYKMGTVPVKDKDGNPTGKNKKKLQQKKIGSAMQYPMKLGYAVTIHKSQGQTYDAMNLEPEIWDFGQLYVALSRCKTAENIFISRPLYPFMVKTSDEVLKYYNAPDEYSFFDEGDIVVNMAIPKKYEKRIKNLLEQWAKEDEENDGYVPQAVPQNDNSYQNSSVKNKPENYQFTFDDMADNSLKGCIVYGK